MVATLGKKAWNKAGKSAEQGIQNNQKSINISLKNLESLGNLYFKKATWESMIKDFKIMHDRDFWLLQLLELGADRNEIQTR